MIKEEKKDVIKSLMFLADKRDGSINGRACVDVRGQRRKFKKEDAESPTVAIESVFITSDIVAHEGRNVAAINIPSALTNYSSW